MEALLYIKLTLANMLDQPYTFSGPGGESNVDLTLTTGDVYLANWPEREEVSASDHNVITYTAKISRLTTRAAPVREPPRFRDRGVDWNRFQAIIKLRMGWLHVEKPAALLAEEFSGVIIRFAGEGLGELRPRGLEGVRMVDD
ncbi:unnamed protein product [Parnassius mnemosyne]|uniref:Uncharacterized protein n=1 Tax=Parnassius mnemosyne TaxID=213953 RepID=A0AAV1KSI0_9NEOP